jgi:transposase
VATIAPDWLRSKVPQEWFDRYARAVNEYRLPKGIAARQEYAQTIGRDGMQLLIAVYDDEIAPQWLRQVPTVEILRQTWVHQLNQESTLLMERVALRLPQVADLEALRDRVLSNLRLGKQAPGHKAAQKARASLHC